MVEADLPWTPIALGADVPAGTTRAIRLRGEELVAWRSASGLVQVWEDRCPHRGMRLSYGFVRGERLACLYHGWEYGTGASCARIPAHPDLTVPASIKVKAWQVVDAGGLIWAGRDAGAPPPMPERLPLASLAIRSTPARLTATIGSGDAPLVCLMRGGVSLHLGWHQSADDEFMLHAVVDPGTDRTAALAALRSLRSDLEAEMAA